MDRTIWYAHEDSDLPDFGRSSIAEVIQAGALEPGDIVYAAWITPSSPSIGEDFLPKATLGRIPPPVLASPPVAPPQPGSQTGCREYCGVTLETYKRDLQRYEQASRASQVGWESSQADAKHRFMEETTSRLSAARPSLISSYPDIRGALYGASRVFESASAKASARGQAPLLKLVIFSGLIERPGSETTFMLPGVRVLIAAYHRHGAPYQQEGVTTWTTLLRTAGAEIAGFLPDNATTYDDVIKFVSERG